MIKYPKRLIEVDLPIKRISAHARREKSIRHGHICTLHIWWARRPLAACRAVICASLWPDPADDLCPDEFRKTARELMTQWAKDHLKLTSEESSKRFTVISKDDSKLEDNFELRKALLDFIADFANWDNSTVPEYLETSRLLTQTAHEALGGERGSHPLVVDPFAGGGSIPLEALRIGAEAFASDLNPIAVLINKLVLEYVPKYGQQLLKDLHKLNKWIENKAKTELSQFYPSSNKNVIPLAYIWARTIKCEGPTCGVRVPLIKSLWLAKKSKNSVALRIVINSKQKKIQFEIINDVKVKDVGNGTIRKGAATCPVCGYTIPLSRVKKQFQNNEDSKTLICVIEVPKNGNQKFYRIPTKLDIEACSYAEKKLESINAKYNGTLSLYPTESTCHYHSFVNRASIYGLTTWDKYYTKRQLLSLSIYRTLTKDACDKIFPNVEKEYYKALRTCLALQVSRLADFNSSLCALNSTGGRGVVHVFGRQALPMVWDFAETNPLNHIGANWSAGNKAILKFIADNKDTYPIVGSAHQIDAAHHGLPDDSAQAFITDPPYYFAVQYADLSDYFYVWLRRLLIDIEPQLFAETETPKENELIVQSPGDVNSPEGKNRAHYETGMMAALSEGRRILAPDGIGTVVFAHKSTDGWEAMLEALIAAGWIVTASWPIDTERPGRVISIGRSMLASSIHLVCRPRENPDGLLRTDDIGDWRDVLAELPKRIHDWMPRLAEEGVVGADAIFACLGPALEIYSRYSSVEKASGEKVELKEYLEQVWAAVSREALKMIFEGADASGFEEDARLTAMWLWTLRTAANGNNKAGNDAPAKSLLGYSLEYDAARKIAQGLGAHLENLSHLVEIKGNTATLLSAGARTRYLFVKDAGEAPKGRKKKKTKQLTFNFGGELKQVEKESGDWAGDLSGRAGSTVLDKLHQSMILFGAGRGEAVKKFLVDDGIGMNPLYWRLAQALSALYPSGTDEKRWVDGVLARKKGLGF